MPKNKSHPSLFAHICSFLKNELSNLLPSLVTKERLWVIRSDRSRQKSDTLSLLGSQKTSESLEKPMRKFPTLVFLYQYRQAMTIQNTVRSMRICKPWNCRLQVVQVYIYTVQYICWVVKCCVISLGNPYQGPQQQLYRLEGVLGPPRPDHIDQVRYYILLNAHLNSGTVYRLKGVLGPPQTWSHRLGNIL